MFSLAITLAIKYQSQERMKSPIAWKPAKLHDVGPDGTITYMYWMSARNLGTEYGVSFQKVTSNNQFWAALMLNLWTVYSGLFIRFELHRCWGSHSRS